MSRRSLIIGLIVSVVVIIVLAIFLIIIVPNIKTKNDVVVEDVAAKQENSVDEPLVAILENKNEEPQENPIYIRDAATITQEIQEANSVIGTLNIPKTGLNSEVYCKQDANKMEEMPCMLYTNEGINQPGITILVGHNRENGTLFSNNNMLEENDEIYFTDLEGVEKRYIVYSKFATSNDDVSFYNTPSESPVIAMQCCLTANTSDRVLIIMAKAEN